MIRLHPPLLALDIFGRRLLVSQGTWSYTIDIWVHGYCCPPLRTINTHSPDRIGTCLDGVMVTKEDHKTYCDWTRDFPVDGNEWELSLNGSSQHLIHSDAYHSPLHFSSNGWCFFRWVIRFDDWVNDLPHILQTWGLSPVCEEIVMSGELMSSIFGTCVYQSMFLQIWFLWKWLVDVERNRLHSYLMKRSGTYVTTEGSDVLMDHQMGGQSWGPPETFSTCQTEESTRWSLVSLMVTIAVMAWFLISNSIWQRKNCFNGMR